MIYFKIKSVEKDLIHPGKELDSLKNAIHSSTLDEIAIPKKKQKVKTLVDLTRLRL